MFSALHGWVEQMAEHIFGAICLDFLRFVGGVVGVAGKKKVRKYVILANKINALQRYVTSKFYKQELTQVTFLFIFLIRHWDKGHWCWDDMVPGNTQNQL